MNFIELRPGKSVEGSPINCYKTEGKNAQYTYLMAGTHGDEVEGVYVLSQIFSWLRENGELELPIVVIPVLNVDGYRAGTRVNSHGVDLNRNYPSKCWTSEYKEKKYFPGPEALSEPENKFLVELFERYPPKFILSFHSWKPMINYNGKCKDIAEYLGKFNNYEVVGEIENYPTPGSLGEYGPQNYDSPVLTFECPLLSDGVTLGDIWGENEKGLKSLFQSSLLH